MAIEKTVSNCFDLRSSIVLTFSLPHILCAKSEDQEDTMSHHIHKVLNGRLFARVRELLIAILVVDSNNLPTKHDM